MCNKKLFIYLFIYLTFYLQLSTDTMKNIFDTSHTIQTNGRSNFRARTGSRSHKPSTTQTEVVTALASTPFSSIVKTTL